VNKPHSEPDTLLALDIGEVHTRAVLFEVVEGRYRFLAIGTAPTTAAAPYHHIGEGIRLALNQLQEITGRQMIGNDQRLIVPGREDGSGIDQFVATMSAGPPLKVVAIGLLEDISLASARHLVNTTYAQVSEMLSLNDHRQPEDRLDTLLRLRPDVVVLAGGTEGGASDSVLRLADSVALACSLLPRDECPEVLYAGNQALADLVRAAFKRQANLINVPNVRPTLEEEQVDPGHQAMAEVFRVIRSRQIPGVKELDAWTGDQLVPSATAFGRVVRFLSRVYDPVKGVLGVDVGASATTAAAAFDGNLTLGVYPGLGLGPGLAELLESTSLESISCWLPQEVSADYVRDYIYNKTLFPASLPVTVEDQAIEQALARQAIRAALIKVAAGFPKEQVAQLRSGLLPPMEPVLASGSVLANAPSLGQSLLLLLDAVQPVGVTTMVLDQHSLMAPLGAAAVVNPVLVVQVLESSTFMNLATVISPVADARPGTPILRLRLSYESGEEMSVDIKQGALEALPVPPGQPARLRLQPLHRADAGMGGPGRGGSVRVIGGALGVVIDARGRPLRLPEDAGRRRELFKKWLWTLGG
jgi:uncharacterized protein (TIGR01319 family)